MTETIDQRIAKVKNVLSSATVQRFGILERDCTVIVRAEDYFMGDPSAVCRWIGDTRDVIEALLHQRKVAREALLKGREYCAAVNANIAGAIGHNNTVVKPDLDFIDGALAALSGDTVIGGKNGN